MSLVTLFQLNFGGIGVASSTPELLWFDGFELDRSQTSLQFNYPDTSGWPTSIANTPGRLGGLSLRSIVGQSHSIETIPLPFTAPSNARNAIVGVGFRAQTPGNNDLFGMVGGQTALSSWTVSSVDNGVDSYTLTFSDSSGTGLFTTDPIEYGEWIFVEAEVLSDDAGECEFRINGEPLFIGVSDFLPSGVPHSKMRLLFPNLSSGYIEYDDLYVTEVKFYGPSFVVDSVTPDAAGSSTEWGPGAGGPNWEEVNDPGDSDGDASYVVEGTDGQTDLYECSPLTLIQGSVIAVRYQIDTRNDNPVNEGVTPEFLINGSNGQGALVTVVDELYQRLSQILPFKPTDLGLWDKGDFEGIEIGMTKGTPVGQIVLPLIDEEGVTGYIFVVAADSNIPLFDEDGLPGGIPTHDGNTKLALFDEDDIEGDFTLEII